MCVRDCPITSCLFPLQITTINLRVKETSGSREETAAEEGGVAKILYNFPLFRISYCGTNEDIPEAFSFVAKDLDNK